MTNKIFLWAFIGAIAIFILWTIWNALKLWHKQFRKDCRLIDEIDYPDTTIEDLKKIIRDGANVNGNEENGVTPLMAAIKNGRIEVIKLLVECNADIKAKDKDGQTVMDYVMNTKKEYMIEYFQSLVDEEKKQKQYNKF